MNLQQRIVNHFEEHLLAQQNALAELGELIEVASERIVAALLNDRKVLTCGNGRSATCAQLLVCLLINQYERDRPALPAIALSNDSISWSAIMADSGSDETFAKPIRALGQGGDVLVIYNDGEYSGNIVKAIKIAQIKDIAVVVLTGKKNEAISNLLTERDLELAVPASSASHAHELHVVITHCLCDLVDCQLFAAL